ncbi:MAG: DegT/DnrJ/EryC1/StrS family aminotransferase [Chthoniobacterales bacterium]
MPSNRILCADPRAGYLVHKNQIDAAIARVLESGWYILGREVSSFESQWAAYLGADHSIGVGNGTDALELALRALGIGHGDTVITTSNTAVATVAAIELSGASPLLVEVDADTLNMSPIALEAALVNNTTKRVKAIVPVHLYGQPADMSAILDLAHRYDLRVIEDCAQAHGAKIDGRRVGTFGDAAAFSFYPTKNLAALGDGGAVVTNDVILAERLRALRSYGWRERYVSEEAGMNTRLDELQAAILRQRLPFLEEENARRRDIARHYQHSLGTIAKLRLPRPAPEVRHVYHQFVIRLEKRDELRAHLLRDEIETAVLYPIPIHLQPAYRDRIATAGPLPITERSAQELLCLPIHPWLEDAEIARVSRAIADWCHD